MEKMEEKEKTHINVAANIKKEKFGWGKRS
jgi:hypothetical protein